MRRTLLPAVGVLTFVLLWELLVRLLHIAPYLVPAPSAVLAEVVDLPRWYAINTLATLWVTLAGFGCATLFGIAFAVLIVEWRALDRLLFPVFVAVNSVPKVALAPLLIIWFGTGALPKVAIAFLVAVFPVVIDAAVGLRSAPPDVLDLAQALRASRLKILLRIKFYCALHSIFAGLKVAISLALVGAIVAEFVSSQSGLGYVILSAQGTFDTTRVFAALVLLAVLGMGLIATLDALERRSMPWVVKRT